MSIKKLPKAGSKFRVKSNAAGSFEKKLRSEISKGNLKHLGDNKDAIIEALKKKEVVIRRGGLDRKQKIAVYKDIKNNTRLTKQDARDVKKIIKNLGKNTLEEEGSYSFEDVKHLGTEEIKKLKRNSKISLDLAGKALKWRERIKRLNIFRNKESANDIKSEKKDRLSGLTSTRHTSRLSFVNEFGTKSSYRTQEDELLDEGPRFAKELSKKKSFSNSSKNKPIGLTGDGFNLKSKVSSINSNFRLN